MAKKNLSIRKSKKAARKAGLRFRSATGHRQNAPKMRKGKTNRWISGKAFKVTRKRGKLVVQVKR